MARLWAGLLVSVSALGSGSSDAKDAMDSALRAEIGRIRVIDDHTHDDPVSIDRGSAWRPDSPLGASSYPDVVPLSRDNPQWIRAWKALYGYKHSDFAPEHLSALLATKRRRMSEAGNSWPTTVLDASGVEIAFVNAPRLGVGQESTRFRWVPFADPLLAPFSGSRSLAAYPGGPVTLADLVRDSGKVTLPANLDEYLAKIVDPTLTRWESAGAPAVKFLSAYWRRLDFDVVPRERAVELYRRGAGGNTLSRADEKAIEDYLFFEVSTRAAEHGLVVQIHTGNGNGPYFNNGDANPELLEAAIGSEQLRKTRFVLLHGGWPYHLVAQAMMDKPNVYADFSAQTFYLSTHALAEVLRGWLEWHPEKVLFGTDAYSDEQTPLSDFEEKQWLLTEKSRDALTIALSSMLDDGEITRDRASKIAAMVLRENAIQLYSLERNAHRQ